MPNTFDGNYDYTKPWRDPANRAGNPQPKWSYTGPWASNEERLTQQALMVMTIPGVDIQEMVRPNLPQIRLFPPRFGFGVRPQIGIDDVISIDRVYTEPRVSWYSGGVAGYTGSSRNDLGAN